MKKPVWVNNIEEDEELSVFWLESTNEYVIVATDKDGEITSGDNPLEDGFKTEDEAYDFLRKLGF